MFIFVKVLETLSTKGKKPHTVLQNILFIFGIVSRTPKWINVRTHIHTHTHTISIKKYFNIILTFIPNFIEHFYHPMRATCPSHLMLPVSITLLILSSSQIMQLITAQISPPPCHLLSLRSQSSPQFPFAPVARTKLGLSPRKKTDFGLLATGY